MEGQEVHTEEEPNVLCSLEEREGGMEGGRERTLPGGGQWLTSLYGKRHPAGLSWSFAPWYPTESPVFPDVSG